MQNKPGRNDPCPCGSRRKYKRCHGERSAGPSLLGSLRRARTSRAPVLDEGRRQKMRVACRFNSELMDFVRSHVKAGVRTDTIDELVHDYTMDHGHTPACLGYRGFPRSCCISINEVVCHGIPDETELREGDIVNVDLTTVVDGWYGDQSETFLIGNVSGAARHLVQVTLECLYLGIAAARPQGSIGEIGKAIVARASEQGFSVVREYQGHGVGERFHQDPDVPHYFDTKHDYDVLAPGVCFTVEPMINEGVWQTELDRGDGWTVRTRDRKLSAQFEHTVLMTEEGPEILTLTQDGPGPDHRF